MNVQYKAQLINMAALCWMFIDVAVLCYAYAGYVILCAITLRAGHRLLHNSAVRLYAIHGDSCDSFDFVKKNRSASELTRILNDVQIRRICPFALFVNPKE